jgi:hypothetical protein
LDAACTSLLVLDAQIVAVPVVLAAYSASLELLELHVAAVRELELPRK